MHRYPLHRPVLRLARGGARRALLQQLMPGIVMLVLSGLLLQASAASVAAADQAPAGLVYDYYQAIDARAFSIAYGYLGGRFTSEQSLPAFTAGFADTVYDDLVVDAVEPDPIYNRLVSHVTITAWHTDGAILRFVGTYTEGSEGGAPKLVDAALAEVPVSDDIPPLCDAADLRATMTGDAGVGQRYGTITATNIAAGPCVLGGVPAVNLRDGHGDRLIAGQPESGVPITTVRLDPGQGATLDLHWSNWCNGAVTGTPNATVTFAGDNGSLDGLTGIGVPPCLSDPAGTSTLRVKPWQMN